MKLKTKRLILRQPTMKDVKDIASAINNLNISKWLLVVPYPYKLKDAKWYVNHCKEKVKKKDGCNFSIEFEPEKKIVGGISINKIDKRQGTGILGYWLAQPYWRRGIMSEALERVLKFAFNQLKLRRLEAEVFVGNKASASLLKKFGFKYEGVRRKACKSKATGKIHDGEIYGLLKEEWK